MNRPPLLASNDQQRWTMFDIPKLAAVPGVLACAAHDPRDTFSLRTGGDEKLREFLLASLALARHGDGAEIRVSTLTLSVLVKPLPGADEVVAVAFAVGHGINKSIHRTIRRCARAKRGAS